MSFTVVSHCRSTPPPHPLSPSAQTTDRPLTISLLWDKTWPDSQALHLTRQDSLPIHSLCVDVCVCVCVCVYTRTGSTERFVLILFVYVIIVEEDRQAYSVTGGFVIIMAWPSAIVAMAGDFQKLNALKVFGLSRNRTASAEQLPQTRWRCHICPSVLVQLYWKTVEHCSTQ